MLTTAQRATLKTHINGNQAYAGFVAVQDWNSIAIDLANPANPQVIVWKTAVNPDEIMRNGMDWTRVDNLTVGKARIWDWMTRLGTFNPSKTNIRAGIDAAWVGTAADLAVRATIYTHCKRAANKLEALFATGTGTDASPATMATGADGQYVEGTIFWTEIQQAMTE